MQQPAVDLFTKVKGGLCCLRLLVWKLWKQFHIASLKWANYEMDAGFSTQAESQHENRLHMETISQPTLALARLVTATDTTAASEGDATAEVMNDCLMWNQATWSEVVAL